MSGRNLVLIAMVVACGWAFYYLYQEGSEFLEPAPKVTRDVTPAVQKDLPAPPPDLVVIPPKKPPERRELEIRGVVVGDGLQVVGGGQIRIGEETAAIGEDGQFAFPAAVRPRGSTVEYVKEDRKITWEFVLTGDEDRSPERTQAASSKVFGWELPVAPERLRWTLNLAPRGVEALSSDGVQERDRQDDETYRVASTAVLSEDWGRGGRAKVRGRSNLPSSLHVSCELRFDKGRVAGSVSPGEINDGVWETEIYFDPGGPFFAGAYRIVSSFSVLLENSATLDGLDDSVLKQFENRSEIVGECEVFLGLRADALVEDRAVQEYFGKLRSDVLRLDKTLRSRLRDFRSLSQGWSPQVVSAHRNAHKTWFFKEVVRDDGMLNEPVWRKFLDEEWRPELEGFLATHRERGRGKYVEAENRGLGMLDSLLRLSLIHSTNQVYQRFNLPPHPNDDYSSGSDIRGDVQLLESRLKENIAEIERFTRLVPEVKSKGKGRRPRF
ncbi:MAG: hypothetical protein AAF517_09030 [Planctomycetota bacterium]